MKGLYKVAKIIFFVCAALFFLLIFVMPACAVFAIICLVIALLINPEKMVKKSTAPTGRDKPSQSNGAHSGPPDYVVRDKGLDILHHAPPPVEGLGFANFPEYTIKGKKKTTNRVNTRRVRAPSEDAARELILAADELMEPLEISLSEFEPAISTDLEYGLKIPAGASRWDARLFENSVLAHDTKHIPPQFMEYATGHGIPLSWLAGRIYAAETVIRHINEQEKIALYGYAVHCSLHGCLPGNIEKEPTRIIYAQFANAAIHDAKAYESIIKRPGSDLWAPVKNTNAYRFAENYFSRQ